MLEKSQNASPEHRHHWVIGEPNGPVSMGHCTLCEASREFQNWLPDGDFVTTATSRGAGTEGRPDRRGYGRRRAPQRATPSRVA